MHIYIYIHLCIYIYTQIYINLCLYIYAYVCICIHMYVYMCVCICVYIYIYIFVCVFVCVSCYNKLICRGTEVSDATLSNEAMHQRGKHPLAMDVCLRICQ